MLFSRGKNHEGNVRGGTFLIGNGKICKNREFSRDNSQNVKHIISSTSSGNHLQRNVFIRETWMIITKGKDIHAQQGVRDSIYNRGMGEHRSLVSIACSLILSFDCTL